MTSRFLSPPLEGWNSKIAELFNLGHSEAEVPNFFTTDQAMNFIEAYAGVLRDELRSGPSKSEEAEGYGSLSWSVGDLHSLVHDVWNRDIPEDVAEQILSSIEGHLCDRLTEVGWEVMETLVAMDPAFTPNEWPAFEKYEEDSEDEQ